MSESIVSYDAEEAGGLLGRSANWMKTQARAGNIPYTQVGREKRWTPQHIAEILRAGERRPRAVLAARTPARRRAAAGDAAPLRARPQRRKTDAA